MAPREIGERRQIRGYETVRAAARDFATYSSDLIGDRHARNYRQLPLELDPPEHTAVRRALQPMFFSSAIKPKVPQFEEAARSLIGDLTDRAGCEFVSGVALPYVVRCFTIVYDRPQDYDEWLSWGADVFAESAHDPPVDLAPGRKVHDYLVRVFERPREARFSTDTDADVWDFVSQLEVDGRRISLDEMYGIGNLLLAGGRDTLVRLISGLAWHLAGHPDDRAYLMDNPESVDNALAEMVRYFSPLKRMERVLPADRANGYSDRDPSKYVLLSFVSANFDRRIWADAERLDIRRERKPHLGFGFGRHTCIGMKMAEHVSKAFLSVLLRDWPGWQLHGEPDIRWIGEDDIKVTDEFLAIRMRAEEDTPRTSLSGRKCQRSRDPDRQS
jgi:cytochrome P450